MRTCGAWMHGSLRSHSLPECVLELRNDEEEGPEHRQARGNDRVGQEGITDRAARGRGGRGGRGGGGLFCYGGQDDGGVHQGCLGGLS